MRHALQINKEKGLQRIKDLVGNIRVGSPRNDDKLEEEFQEGDPQQPLNK